MNYAKVKNGVVIQVGLPSVGIIDGCSISGYNYLPTSVLQEEGWLPLVDNPPSCENNQIVQLTGYLVQESQVVAQYEVVAKQDELTIEEQIARMAEQLVLAQEALDFLIMGGM